MSENRTRSQQLRDRFYVNFSNYRQGISWICGRIKLPKALQALERKEAGSLHAVRHTRLNLTNTHFRLFKQDEDEARFN